RGGSWAESWTVGMLERTIIPTVQPSNIRLKRLRLIDQHDGNVVLDGIDQPARVTGEGFRIEAMLEGAFALGADEDLEQVGREAHEAAYPSRLRAGSLRRHLGRTFTCNSRKTRWSPSSVSIFARAAGPDTRRAGADTRSPPRRRSPGARPRASLHAAGTGARADPANR